MREVLLAVPVETESSAIFSCNWTGPQFEQALVRAQEILSKLIEHAAELEGRRSLEEARKSPLQASTHAPFRSGYRPRRVPTKLGLLSIRMPLVKYRLRSSSIPVRLGSLSLAVIGELIAILARPPQPDEVARLFGSLCDLVLRAEESAWLCQQIERTRANFCGPGAAAEAYPIGLPAPRKWWVQEGCGQNLLVAPRPLPSAFLARRRAREKAAVALPLRAVADSGWLAGTIGTDLLASALGEELCARPALAGSGQAALIFTTVRPPAATVAAICLRGAARPEEVLALHKYAAAEQSCVTVVIAARLRGPALRAIFEANRGSYPGSGSLVHFGFELQQSAGLLQSRLLKLRCGAGPSQAVPAPSRNKPPSTALARLLAIQAAYAHRRGQLRPSYLGFRGLYLRVQLAICDVVLELAGEEGELSPISLVLARPARRQNRSIFISLLKDSGFCRDFLIDNKKYQSILSDSEQGQYRIELGQICGDDPCIAAEMIRIEKSLRPRLRQINPEALLL